MNAEHAADGHKFRNELGYTERETERLFATADRVLRYTEVPMILVGGLANRIQFPVWAHENRPKLSDGIDLVFDVDGQGQRMLDPKIQDKFYVTHLIPEFGAHYVRLVDKETNVDVDCFVRERPLETHSTSFSGQEYRVRTPAEVFLKTARDVYQFLNDEQNLEDKHLTFLAFLRHAGVPATVSPELWQRERQFLGRPELSLDQYLEEIDQLVRDHGQYLVTFHPFNDQYPADQPEIHGLHIVDEATWQTVISNRYKRR